jgi:acyl-CoA thioesterase
VGDLEKDTTVVAVDGAEGQYTARLSDDWAIWGPNGGYVSSIALRAAGLASGRARPASIVTHYLGVAQFDEVQLSTTILRQSRVATSLRVTMEQDGRPILEALVWGVDDPTAGSELVHELPTMPEVEGPEGLLSFEEHMAAVDQESPFVFWNNLEHRPLAWRDDWPPPGPVEPTARWWMRFRPTAVFDHPWVDACRLLIPIDTMGWPAGSSAHAYREPLGVIAPTIDLSVRFHRAARPDDEWLLADAVAPVAAGGLLAATGRIWNRRGELLASGGQTMLCRPIPVPGGAAQTSG